MGWGNSGDCLSHCSNLSHVTMATATVSRQRPAAAAFQTTSTIFSTIFDQAGARRCRPVVSGHMIYRISFNSKCRQSKKRTQSFNLFYFALQSSVTKKKGNVPLNPLSPRLFETLSPQWEDFIVRGWILFFHTHQYGGRLLKSDTLLSHLGSSDPVTTPPPLLWKWGRNGGYFSQVIKEQNITAILNSKLDGN